MLILLLIIPLIGVLFLLPINEDNIAHERLTELDLTNGVGAVNTSNLGLEGLTNANVVLHLNNKYVNNLKEKVRTQEREKMKKIALFFSLLNLLVSLIIWFQYDYNTTSYQFVLEFSQLKFCDFHIGIDGISLYFVLLTTFITPLCILSNWSDINTKLKYFLISFLILETLQIAVFVVLDLFLFYIFFESVLIPLFFIVIIWGGSNKYRAAFLLFLYTLAGSLFMLLAILYIYQNTGTTDFLYLSLVDINNYYQKILWLAFFLSFAIKTPLFPFHIWLFRAHAEAPLGGSIILAAVILKLASYGFLRVLLPLLPDASNFFLPLVQSIASITIIYASLSTLNQTDTKQLVAMSSVAHMGVVVLAIFSNNVIGLEGSILLGISHGFVSPALFICVGGIIYIRFHTRIIFLLKGLVNRMPVFTTLFFIFTLFNTAIPLSLNYLGEFLSLVAIFLQSPFISILGASGIVLSAAYSIWAYARISYGSYSKPVIDLAGIVKDIDRREFFLLLPLFLTTLIFGLFPNYILEALHISTSLVLYN